jgi:putative redox protein
MQTDDGLTPTIEITMQSAAGYAQVIHAGTHRLTADEPESSGGTGTGPRPYALLLSGLGACTAITLRMYADRKGWSLGVIDVRLRMLKSKDGRERIDREIGFGAPLTPEQRARLIEIAGKTPVTRTISAGAPITTTVLETPFEPAV